MTTNTMPLSKTEEEVRNILDEAISASVTASTPGISWGKLMTIIQMQKPLVDDYISQRRKIQPIREVNIGDSVNPFKAEIVKLICALQLTGRITNTTTAPLEVTRTNNRVIDPCEVSSCDSYHQAEHEIITNKKCKNSKWGVKHFGKANKMHEISDETHLFNKYNDAAGAQNCGPFPFTFNAHKEGKTKVHESENLNEAIIDSATYRDDYNSYLVARYESEYGDVNLLSAKNGEFSNLHDEEEETQYGELHAHVLNKSSTNHQFIGFKNKSENLAGSSSSCHIQKLQKCKSKDNGMHCGEQTSEQSIDKISQHYHSETCEKGKENLIGTNSFPAYSVICADSSSEHLAQMSHKKANEYSHNNEQEKQVTDEQKLYLDKGKDAQTVCELYRMEHKLYSYNSVDSASKGNCPNNKILETNDQLNLCPISGLPSPFSNENHVVVDKTYITKDGLEKCSSSSKNTAEYLFQNFIQPEDESNIQLLLEHNLSSGHNSSLYKNVREISEIQACTLGDAMGKQKQPQYQINIADKNKETVTNVLEYSSQIKKDSCDSLNDKKGTGRKEVLQECQQGNDIQQHLSNTSSSTTTSVSNLSVPYVNTATYECQKTNSCDQFSNKKVYWSSVGLIIEDLIDTNILPVAGHSDMSVAEPQESKVEEKCSSIYDNGSTRDQMTHSGNTSWCRTALTDEIEDASFTTELDVKGSTNVLEKDGLHSGNLLSEKTFDNSKNTKKSKQKKSFIKSLQRVFHVSRKH